VCRMRGVKRFKSRQSSTTDTGKEFVSPFSWSLGSRGASGNFYRIVSPKRSSETRIA